jgi:ribonuclease BN (tRNA processing enzyme)
MKRIGMADVGDGLCMKLNMISDSKIYIDCGSQQGGECAFKGLKRIDHDYCHRSHFLNQCHVHSIFILSHFHADHYNGLIHVANNTQQGYKFNLDQIYFPLIPDFELRKEFMTILFCMAQTTLGNKTGSMPADLINVVRKINSRNFMARPLSEGETLYINGVRLEILWPPRTLPKNKEIKIVSEIEKSIDKFEELKDKYEQIQDTYDKIKSGNLFEPYFSEQPTTYESTQSNEEIEKPATEQAELPLPNEIKEFNGYLRDVANYFSLSFVIDDRFLFLGDLGTSEIGQVISKLNNDERRNFYVLVAPHHGTHWHHNLRRAYFVYTLSSVGCKLVAKMNPEFKAISEFKLATHVNGDIILPFRFCLNCCYSWYCHYK